MKCNQFDRPMLADHLYYEGPIGDTLYEDGEININGTGFHDNGCTIPAVQIAIHSVELAFELSDVPDRIVCDHCGSEPLQVDDIEVDGCMGGLLPGVRNACCGHGNPDDAYIQWDELDEDQSGAFYYPRYKSIRGIIAYSIICHYSR